MFTRWRLPASSAGFVQRAIHLGARFTRPLTIGVRAMILDGADRVFLVRHSYVPGWHLPGGAVEADETLGDALAREVREECNIEVLGRPMLHGIFFNRSASRRDHVVVYRVREFREIGPRRPDWEIVESGFFARAALPDDTTRATKARLAEALDGQASSATW